MKSAQRCLQSLLRCVRNDAGLNQKQLAEKLNKPQSFVSKYESGERRLDVLEVRTICHALGIDFVHFIILFEEKLEMANETESDI